MITRSNQLPAPSHNGSSRHPFLSECSRTKLSNSSAFRNSNNRLNPPSGQNPLPNANLNDYILHLKQTLKLKSNCSTNDNKTFWNKFSTHHLNLQITSTATSVQSRKSFRTMSPRNRDSHPIRKNDNIILQIQNPQHMKTKPMNQKQCTHSNGNSHNSNKIVMTTTTLNCSWQSSPLFKNSDRKWTNMKGANALKRKKPREMSNKKMKASS